MRRLRFYRSFTVLLPYLPAYLPHPFHLPTTVVLLPYTFHTHRRAREAWAERSYGGFAGTPHHARGIYAATGVPLHSQYATAPMHSVTLSSLISVSTWETVATYAYS